ncbi:enoyl-CoA hydratase-related protein [Limnohabitans sp. TEGF004]|uniref:enoyl-CoA hydratase/isomerase family protein n=1 Tax=Limnohabitans sp. TEGF004 TaxID=2986281 RepID=UPI0023778FEF|nr:enoyl-CoA hydratase-related protein [Limnohabitans sp. TEGF004]BDU54980.1 3-hydroxybutyryl-CoA dehydratase [Limnohabitans sp. TEGF004]
MTEGTPLLDISGAVATLTLRRPSQRNSLTDDDLNTLLAHFETINRNTAIHAVVLRADTSTQKQAVFSAGYNVGGFDNDPMAPLFFEKIPEALERLRPVTICALNGSVYGGATDLVLACDFTVAQRGYTWRMPAAALGLHYYPSGLRRYVSRLGVQASKRAFLLGQSMAYEDLETLGLFEALVNAEAFEATLEKTVQALCGMAPLALQATKKSLNEIAAGLYSEPALKERSRQSVHTQDFTEGRAAFAERRTPKFTGR